MLALRRIRVQDGSLQTASDSELNVVAMYLRIRAFWSSMAYVNVDQPSYMDLQTAETMSDKALTWLHARHSQRPGVEFFVQAWDSTARVLQTAIRSGDSLVHACAADSTFQHFWTVYVPDKGTAGAARGSKDTSPPQRPQRDELSTESRMQRSKDLQIAALKRELDQAKGRGGWHEEERSKSKKQKGKGKGKGK